MPTSFSVQTKFNQPDGENYFLFLCESKTFVVFILLQWALSHRDFGSWNEIGKTNFTHFKFCFVIWVTPSCTMILQLQPACGYRKVGR